MNTIPFIKATAYGNDFLIIDAQYAPANINAFTRRICDRHNGVGADGVEWVSTAQTSDTAVTARLINSDGGEAEVSGNGTRCVAAWWAWERAAEPGATINVITGAGVKACKLIERGASFEFEMDMGTPQPGKAFTLKLASGDATGVPGSMGNPHFTIFADDFPSNWQALGAEIGKQATFPQGTNVEFVRVLDRHSIDVRFFERGAGETQSSGTGSCAAAVAAISSGHCKSPVTVHAPGGAQVVRWARSVFLRGSAQLLCRGEFFL